MLDLGMFDSTAFAAGGAVTVLGGGLAVALKAWIYRGRAKDALNSAEQIKRLQAEIEEAKEERKERRQLYAVVQSMAVEVGKLAQAVATNTSMVKDVLQAVSRLPRGNE